MDDTLCRRFFAEPRHTRQRHYEILRAHFLENRSLHQIAEQFGLNYYTVRTLVRAFRRAEQPPPFLPRLVAAAPPARQRRPRAPKRPPLPIAVT